MIRVRDRVCALVMALALLAAAPGGVTGRCNTCSAECPMHQHRARSLGCHHGARTTSVPDGQTCLTSAGCGHRTAVDSVALRAVIEPTIAVAPLVGVARRSTLQAAPPSREGAQPPHGPPESLFV